MSKILTLSDSDIDRLREMTSFLSGIRERITTESDWTGNIAYIAADQAVGGILYLVANNPPDLTIEDVSDHRIKELCPRCGAKIPRYSVCAACRKD